MARVSARSVRSARIAGEQVTKDDRRARPTGGRPTPRPEGGPDGRRRHGGPDRRRPAHPEAGDGPGPAAAVHRRRRPGHRDLRADRHGGRGGGRCRLAALPRRLPGRAGHRVQLPGAGYQVPAGRGRGALRAQGVRHPLPHVPRRLRGDELGHHLGIDRARAFSANAAEVFGLDLGEGIGITLIGLGFMTLIALVNHRGVGESVKANVVLTCVELSGLLIVIGVGVWALGIGEGDFSRVTQFDTGDTSVLSGVIAATGLAFFAMVGFEDSVNMAEECKEPRRIFPKVLLLGLGITGVIYVLVSISAIALVPADALSEGETPLLQVVEAGAPGFPLGLFGVITMFAVANTALINMLMASRLVYGLGRERVLPPLLGRVHPTRRTPTTAILFTTALAFGLITFVGAVPALGGTTALLLLIVFTVVNIPVLVLRKDTVDADHFRTPTILPIVGALACGYLATPWAGRPAEQYRIAGILLAIGVVLWGVTVLVNRRTGAGTPRLDPTHLSGG